MNKAFNYWWSFCLIAGVCLCGTILQEYLGYRTIGFLFLLGVLAVGAFNTLGPVLFSAALSTVAWNFLFIPPRFTFAISSGEDVLLCAGYFVAALVTGVLTSRSRTLEQIATDREERTLFLYEVLKDILECSKPADFLARTTWRIEELFGGKCHIVLNGDKVPPEFAGSTVFKMRGREESSARLLYLGPLKDDQRELLEAVTQQLGLSLERSNMEQRLRATERLEVSEKLHQTLFNSVSHELRTPLTALMGFASSLNEETADKPDFRRALASGLLEAGDRMNRVVGNLLNMSRLSSDVMSIKKEWHDVNDLIGVALAGSKRGTAGHKIKVHAPEVLPLVEMDFHLMEIALINLLVNAGSYSPANSEIQILVGVTNKDLQISVIDEGAGVSAEALTRVFEKFYRAPGTPAGGTGLGLSIAKSIVDLHHGSIECTKHATRGAVFMITLPLGLPPRAPKEDHDG